MRIIKLGFALLFVSLIAFIWYHSPILNLITGYSAKNMSSSVFVANRSLEYTNTRDNGLQLVNLADDEIDKGNSWATATVFGVMKRKAVYREGLGSVLINDDYDPEKSYLKPNRFRENRQLPYPYGVLPQKDTIFPEVDYKALEKVVEDAFDKEGEDVKKTRAVLVLYKDQIIAEKYGDDITQDSKILGWSMAKSILNGMYGVLHKEGKIALDDPAPIKEWQNDKRKNITYRNLLQMSSGLEWKEDYSTISDVTSMLFLETDMSKSQIKKELLYEPGEKWLYSSGTTNLLSGLIKKQFKTHQEYLDFPYKNLIDKIGMNSMLLEADLNGNYVNSSYAWATPRDWAKFGLLYLHNGNWNGEQILDPSWIDFTVKPVPDSKGIYGGHFWLNAGRSMRDVPGDMFYANGFQQQNIFIIPSEDLVIVRFGLTDVWLNFNDMIAGIIGATNKTIKKEITSIEN
ncbi:serine hydrolase domain-containing protein [Aquimarina rhabdastrellae]